jgi:hypothetical protein
MHKSDDFRRRNDRLKALIVANAIWGLAATSLILFENSRYATKAAAKQ